MAVLLVMVGAFKCRKMVPYLRGLSLNETFVGYCWTKQKWVLETSTSLENLHLISKQNGEELYSGGNNWTFGMRTFTRIRRYLSCIGWEVSFVGFYGP